MRRIRIVLLTVAVVLLLASCASTQVEEPSSIELMELAEINPDLSDSAWTASFYVDNFGSFTDEAYILNESPGVFSNSATNNSYAKLKILGEQNAIAFEISEYSLGFPVTISSYERVRIQIQLLDGEVVELKNTRISNSSKRIVCEDTRSCSNTYRFYSALLSSGVVKISIRISSDYSSSSYLFAVSEKGLAEAYRKAYLSE